MWKDREWECIEEVGREGLSCRGGRKIKRKGWGREREKKEDRQTQTHRGKRHRDKDTPHPSSATP